MVEVGEKAPDFTLPDTSRKLIGLKEFRGSKLVLAFFPGAFTSTCKKEMCTLRDDVAKLEKMNAQVVGISVSDPFALTAFKEDNMIPFYLLSDYSKETIRAYNIELHNFAGLKGYTVSKRSVFILSSDGIIIWKWVSDNPGVEPPYDEILKAVA